MSEEPQITGELNDDPEESKLTHEVTPEDVLGIIQTGAEIYSEITSNFIQDFVFYEKTLYEWANDLMIELPAARTLDELTFRELLVKLANNIQISSNYYSVASSMTEAIGGGNNIKKSDVVNALVLNFQKRGAKRPAAAVIERMADSYLSSTVSAKIAANIVKSEDEAMDRYGDGEGEDHDYVEFLSIEEKFCESTLNLIRSQQPK